MNMKPPSKPLKTFEVTTRARPSVGEMSATVESKGYGMQINQRGDLLILAGPSSEKVLACFASGSWLRAKEKEEPTP